MDKCKDAFNAAVRDSSSDVLTMRPMGNAEDIQHDELADSNRKPCPDRLFRRQFAVCIPRASRSADGDDIGNRQSESDVLQMFELARRLRVDCIGSRSMWASVLSRRFA